MSTDLKAKFRTQPAISADKVDPVNGIIRDVALVSIGEAGGWNLRADMKSLQGFFELISGKSIKAFLNHEDDPAPTEAVGLYSGFYIDAEAGVLRAAQFKAFKAFRDNDKQGYETLFEMAAEGADAFGTSAVFDYKKEAATDGGSPFVRPIHVDSFDFVGAPAINTALFERGEKQNEIKSQEVLDAEIEKSKQEKLNETQSQLNAALKSQFSTVKTVFAHFSKRPAALPLIAKFAAEMPEDAKPEDVIAKVELALNEEEQAALVKERDDLLAEVQRLKGEVEALKPKEAELAELSVKHAELSKKSEEQGTEIEGYKKSRARFGIQPIVTEKNDATKKSTELTGIARVSAAFAKAAK
jgi:hypothetical protein